MLTDLRTTNGEVRVSDTRPAAVIILAAGEGTRMRSSVPKVLHTLAGRSLVGHALDAARAVNPLRTVAVVRHQRDAVSEHILSLEPSILIADQDDIKGTGRAAWCGLVALDAAVAAAAVRDGVPDDVDGLAALVTQAHGPVVITSGDVPMLDGATLTEFLDSHIADGNAVTVLTTELDDPTGYGRIVRDAATGQVSAIVEHRDASDEQLEIREINGGVYVMDADVLRRALGHVGSHNAQGEVYLTDVIELAVKEGLAVRAIRTDDPWLLEGINDRVQLSQVSAEMNRRIVEDWMLSGVTVIDPATTWIDVDVELEQDVTILPGTQLLGHTSVGKGSVVGPDSTLTDVSIGRHASVIRVHGSGAKIGDHATVGPFSYLRPGTVVGSKGKIGAFVEAKNVVIGHGAKVPHLSYVGDAEIGDHSNFGAGTIIANYDGVKKHRTVIGSHVRIGANNVMVAPVIVGDGAYTAAGSVIRHEVSPGSLGVSAGPQRNVEGWVVRRRPGTAAAEAAGAAPAPAGEVSSERAEDPQPAIVHGLSPQAQAELARNARVGTSESHEGNA